MNTKNNFPKNDDDIFFPEDSYLVELLIEFSKSPQSLQFYRKAIKHLGEDIVHSILSEAKMRCYEGTLDNQAKYLTTLLKNELDTIPKFPLKAPNKLKNGQIDNLVELTSKEVKKESLEPILHQMPIPYGKDSIQSPRFVSQDFFTLPQDKNKYKSDVVKTIISINGKPVKAKLLRGKIFKEDSDRGILTTEHARILNAIEHIWAREQCIYKKDKEENRICVVEVELMEIAKLIGMKSYSGRNEAFLKRKISDIDKTAFYLHSFQNEEDINGIGFKIASISSFVSKNKNGRSSISIMFSEVYSRFLLDRKAVTRPLEMLKIRNEIAFKLYMFIFPKLMKNNSFKIDLIELIKFLSLPKAEWHDLNNKRKEYFSKAIKHLEGKIINSKKLQCSIITENKNHFLLAVIS